MAVSFIRPPSPSREAYIFHGHDDDHLVFTLYGTGSSAHPEHNHDMIKEKEKAGIDIVVDSDCLFLKGTGVDVEPVMLNGHIALHLREPTSIKAITLQFRGKAKLPLASAESLPLSTTPQWYTICKHEWSFLAGAKRRGHTLKAGSHKFPFQLQLGGSLPSSIASDVFGGTHVRYKLKAVAVRPGLAANMQTVAPIYIVRTFAPQSLEYQQSLEIENTWPEKLMYSIMLPHKAWAAGDELSTVVKFSPLSKGVRVLMVETTILETTKLHCRGGVQEYSRTVVSATHSIPNGTAERHATMQGPPLGLSSENRSGPLVAISNQDLTLQGPSAGSSHEFRPTPASTSDSSAEPSTSTSEEAPPAGRDDVVSHLTVFIPKSVTPSHSLQPITVFHRAQWSIFMSNLDGHTSELRCSLPIHILDPRLLDEARANSAATRQLLLYGSESPANDEQDAQLPSYSSHVRDRVANMYLPDAVTTRVPNPWVHSNVSPTFAPERQPLSGAASPLMPHPVSSHLPPTPQSGSDAPLDWVDSELLVSLSNTGSLRGRANSSNSHSPDSASGPGSGAASRRVSRAPSPEPFHLATTASLPVAPMSASHETFVHDSHASRALPSLFGIQMKPHSSLTSPIWHSSRPNSRSNVASSSSADAGHARRASPNVPWQLTLPPPAPVPAPSSPQASTPESIPESTLWRRAFTEVPDYGVASRGFIGGVTPLTSMRGLPSYAEAGRGSNGGNSSDGDDG